MKSAPLSRKDAVPCTVCKSPTPKHGISLFGHKCPECLEKERRKAIESLPPGPKDGDYCSIRVTQW